MQTHVTIPWGDWLVLALDQLAPIVIALVVTILAWLCRKLPAPLAFDHVDPLTAWAAQYGETLFPQLVAQLGARFRPMILARISAVTAISGAAKATAPLPAPPIGIAKPAAH